MNSNSSTNPAFSDIRSVSGDVTQEKESEKFDFEPWLAASKKLVHENPFSPRSNRRINISERNHQMVSGSGHRSKHRGFEPIRALCLTSFDNVSDS